MTLQQAIKNLADSHYAYTLINNAAYDFDDNYNRANSPVDSAEKPVFKAISKILWKIRDVVKYEFFENYLDKVYESMKNPAEVDASIYAEYKAVMRKIQIYEGLIFEDDENSSVETAEKSAADNSIKSGENRTPFDNVNTDAHILTAEEYVNRTANTAANIATPSVNNPALNTVLLQSMLKGKKTSVISDTTREIATIYTITDIANIIPSHRIDSLGGIVKNENYPQELQPRDRENRVTMQTQITKMANTLRPADLMESRSLNQGAAIVNTDGVVLNGNGRIMAITAAYKTDKGNAYRNALIDRAVELGFNPAEVNAIQKPVLVRQVVETLSANDVADITQSTIGGAKLGASEQAQIDASKITVEMLRYYDGNEKGDLTTYANRDFCAAIIWAITNDNDINAYFDAAGNISSDGIKRIRNALFAAAYADNGLIARISESTDDNIRNISNALIAAAPAMATIRIGMARGILYKYDITTAIIQATNRLVSLRNTGQSLNEYLNATSFSFVEKDIPEATEILRYFDKEKRSVKKVATFLNAIAAGIELQGDPNQVSLFSDYQPLSLEKIIQGVLNDISDVYNEGLFGKSTLATIHASEESSTIIIDAAKTPADNAPVTFEATATVDNSAVDKPVDAIAKFTAELSTLKTRGELTTTLDENLIRNNPKLLNTLIKYNADITPVEGSSSVIVYIKTAC